jgi:hypothetical protein
VDREAKTLTVEGAFAPAVGSVVTLDHAGERVSAYTVASVTADGDNTRIEITGDPGFEWDAAEQTSAFAYVPHTSYTGAHVMRQRVVAR